MANDFKKTIEITEVTIPAYTQELEKKNKRTLLKSCIRCGFLIQRLKTLFTGIWWANEVLTADENGKEVVL